MWLYNFLFFLQVGGEGGGTAPSEAARQGAEQAQNGGGAPAAGPCGGGGGLGIEFIIWIVFLFALMYFLMIRPQKKQRQQHEQFLASLKRGDRVVTTGGMLGTVKSLAPGVITLEVSEGVAVRVQREHVVRLQAEAPEDKSEKK